MPDDYRAHLSYALCAKSHLSVANTNIDHNSSAQRCCNGRRERLLEAFPIALDLHLHVHRKKQIWY